MSRSQRVSPPDLSDLPDPRDPPGPPRLTRRDFLAAALLSPAFLRQAAIPGARFVENIPFTHTSAGPRTPLGRLLGSSLDARLFTDLSALSPDALVTPNDRFYIRTAAPASVQAAGDGGRGRTSPAGTGVDLAGIARVTV